MKKTLKFALCAAVLPVVSAFAGQVTFKNGDRVTGQVTEMGGGKLKVVSPTVGTVEVKVDDVDTFSTDEPVDVRLKDGTAVKEKIEASDGGKIAAVSANGQKQQIDLASIKAINPNRDWNGSIRVGGTLTRGNSNTDQLDVAFDAMKRGETDRLTLGAEYQYGRQETPGTGEKSTTLDNWDVMGKYDYFLSEKLYAFGYGKVEHDHIANLDIRFSPAVGLGYQWVETPDMNFSTEAGLGWVYEKFEDDSESDSFFAGRVAYHFDKKLSDKVLLFHNLEFIPDLEDISNFNLTADAGLHVTLTEKMFSEIKAEWKYDSEPAPGASNNDLRYVLSIGWAF